MFNDYDYSLIIELLYHYEKWYNNCMKKALTYKIKSISDNMTEAIFVKNKKESTHKFIPFGFYDEDKQIFKYTNKVDSIIKRYDIIDIFGSDSTIKKLFKNTVKLSSNEHIVILCIIAIFNPAFSIIKINPKKNTTLYALVPLNIKCNLDYNKFIYNMSSVRMSFNVFTKMISKKK